MARDSLVLNSLPVLRKGHGPLHTRQFDVDRQDAVLRSLGRRRRCTGHVQRFFASSWHNLALYSLLNSGRPLPARSFVKVVALPNLTVRASFVMTRARYSKLWSSSGRRCGEA